MSTIRQQLIDAMRVALAGTGKPDGLQVTSRSVPPAENEDLPRLSVSRGGEKVLKPHNRYPVVERTLTVRVDCWTGGQEPEDALEPLLAWVTQVMTSTPGWGGLAVNTAEASTEWDIDEFTDAIGHASAYYTVTFVTKTANQEVQK